MIVDKINAYLSKEEKTLDHALVYEVEKLAGLSFRQKFMEDREFDPKGKLWISQAGKCPRANAYAYHGFEKKGREFDSRAKLIFWAGDLTEMTIVSLAKAAGCQILATGFQQLRVEYQINDNTITGRPDGIVFHEGQFYVLEVKSMSSFRFRDFEEGKIEESYLAQVQAEMAALCIPRTIFVAQNKDAGVLNERVIHADAEEVIRVRENCQAVFSSTPEALPDRPHKPNDKGFLPWNCAYCSYYGHCWPEAKKVVVSGAYKLKVEEKKDAKG